MPAEEITKTPCVRCGAAIPGKEQRRDGMCLGCKASMIRPDWRWKAGDRVQVHGYRGLRQPVYDVLVTGFRGTVEGRYGPCLTGICDDGREWCLQPSVLQAEGAPPRDWRGPCACCPPAPVQESLFELEPS
jgi:hypothetical protein